MQPVDMMIHKVPCCSCRKDRFRVQGLNMCCADMLQLQDEVLELHEKEETAAAEAAAAVERSTHAALMAEANLDGIETLADDMVTADTEWTKLSAVPGLLEPWHDVRDKWQVVTDEFKVGVGGLGLVLRL